MAFGIVRLHLRWGVVTNHWSARHLARRSTMGFGDVDNFGRRNLFSVNGHGFVVALPRPPSISSFGSADEHPHIACRP